ncbi:MAG: IS1 family transposase [Pseudoramibacter sp. EUB1.1]|uniref:IS1 family transposase n=1 Tax=Candidatus Pseudoramibacter fermentans TaxID=2594427 RepID=A0A6L5GUK6_9FIRM|nr:IS1 family transposase [Candidatus Pseudoramibacter fermentans]
MASGAAPGEPARCPRCGSPEVTRKGRSADGRQRWRCKSCGRTFSARTGSVRAMSKLPASTWATTRRERSPASPSGSSRGGAASASGPRGSLRMRLFV